MPKQLLIETRMNSLTLCESKGQAPHPGCLGSLYGPAADFVRPTRNTNLYRRKLWENVFNDDIVKESLEDRILIGELDHPGDRLETKATNACIVMTGYEFHDDEGLLYGSFDILDTPNGRILKSLLDAGCKIGVSSRGEGDVVTEDVSSFGEVNVVDEDNYDFVAFDAVVLPAVKAAKPTLRESLNRETLRESLSKEVNSATTKEELTLLKKIVEATEMPESDSLIESVNNKLQELDKGTTGSSVLVEDLERIDEENQGLKEENRKLKESLTTYKAKYAKQLGSRQKLIREATRQRKSTEELQSQYSDLVFESSSQSSHMKRLEEELKTSRKEIARLDEEISTTGSKLEDSEQRVRSLEESLSKSQDLVRSKINESSALKNQVGSLKTRCKSLEETLSERTHKLQESVNKYSKLCRDYQRAYIESKSASLGIDSADVIKLVGNSISKSKVEESIKTCSDKVQRYRSLPISDDKLIGLLESGTVKFNGSQLKGDPEASQTYQFMEQASKLLY